MTDWILYYKCQFCGHRYAHKVTDKESNSRLMLLDQMDSERELDTSKKLHACPDGAFGVGIFIGLKKG